MRPNFCFVCKQHQLSINDTRATIQTSFLLILNLPQRLWIWRTKYSKPSINLRIIAYCSLPLLIIQRAARVLNSFSYLASRFYFVYIRFQNGRQNSTNQNLSARSLNH